MGSLAKEYPRWQVRVVDLPGELERDETEADRCFKELLMLPAQRAGEALSYRGGQWLKQRLVACQLPTRAHSMFRRGGLYLIIGGAGGIGEALSEYLIREYQISAGLDRTPGP